MFEIDKQKFGAFVAALRREKGLTQKELASRLYISDKAVSKWETGASIPDTALLIPLAELLGVSVTELLMCRRQEPEGALPSGEVEALVKTAISYPCGKVRGGSHRREWTAAYVLSLLSGCAGLLLQERTGPSSETAATLMVLCAAFGAYFCIFVKTRLPSVYDERSLNLFSDGPIRMNLPGLRFHNGNWPRIVTAVRTWTCLVLAFFPWLGLGLNRLVPGLWNAAEPYLLLAVLLGGLLLSVYIVGKKHE